MLRGPQGTLFGRNTTGGAINFITKGPTLSGNEGYVEGGYGNFNTYTAQAAIETTMVEDQLGLRIAGTVEFAGVDAPPNYQRADILLDHGRFLLPGLRDGGVSRWMGCRPSFPDSLPVISSSPHYEKLYYAFGHGHLGLTEGAITGKLIAELIDGRPTSIDVDPYRIDRF